MEHDKQPIDNTVDPPLTENTIEDIPPLTKFAKRHKSVFLFMKASVAAQVASWIDMGLSFVLFAWVGLNAFTSKALGATTGGIINCCINYQWTFQAKDCKKRDVAIKYAMVWLGSLLLNSAGTSLLTNLLGNIPLLESWGINAKACFMVAQITVSLVVSICWNFLLQRNWVYRNISIANFIKNLIKRK